MMNNNNADNKMNSPIPMPMYFHFKGNSSISMVTAGHELDEFLMYIYKVRRCSKKRSHDWIACPYAHKGEKAKRRDPRKFSYTGLACQEFKLSNKCPRGQNCEYAHGVFELWLHPSRYRTRLCEAGELCPRRICFFAHSEDQLRPMVYHDYGQCILRHHLNRSFSGLAENVPTSSSSLVMRPMMMVAEATTGAATLAITTATSAAGSINALQNQDVACTSMEEQFDLPDIDWVLDLVS